jgi:mRNA interferase RelE/StbE
VREYLIQVERNAEKDLDRLTVATRRRAIDRIRALARDPRPPGCVKLLYASDLWRIRFGDYRVIYSVDDERGVVRIEYVRHRKDAYR